jgi:hypothetical protein
MRAPIFYDSNDTGYYVDPAGQSRLGNIERSTHSTGFLVGSYNSVGDNRTNTNPIYTIGNSYKPTDTSLSGMYGIGYTNGGSAPFVSLSGADSWGMYVAANGNARIFLDADNGVVVSTGSNRAPIFYDSNNTGYYVDPAGISNLSQSKFLAGISVNSGSSSATKHGISLYGTQTTGMPAYGLAFTGTAGEGTHGSVTSDWATYFTMSGSTSRGWIFKHQTI